MCNSRTKNLNTQQGGFEVDRACKFDMDNNFKSTSFLPSFIGVKLIFRVSGQILRLLSRVTYLVSSQRLSWPSVATCY